MYQVRRFYNLEESFSHIAVGGREEKKIITLQITMPKEVGFTARHPAEYLNIKSKIKAEVAPSKRVLVHHFVK